MDAYATIRAARTEREIDATWSLSVITTREGYDVAVLKNGRYVSDNDSPIGGPWVDLSSETLAKIESELRAYAGVG